MSSMGSLGSSRNRTDTFLKYRNRVRGYNISGGDGSPSRATEKGTAKLLGAALGSLDTINSTDSNTASVVFNVPPQYVEFKNQVKQAMEQIKAEMKSLQSLYGKATLTTFDDSGDHDEQINDAAQHITVLFRKAEKRLQEFSREASASEADEKVKQNMQRTLAIELQKQSVHFRKMQRLYLSRLSHAKEGGIVGSSASFSAKMDEDSRLGAEDDFDPGFTQAQMARLETHSDLIDERDQEVMKILSSINELGQIMKDLSVLVIEQGTILDRIDYNIEQVATSVEQGVQNLVAAEKKQKQSRVILCIMFLIAMVILMLFVVVFKNVIPLIVSG